jgi:hypothetical protein
LEKGEYATGKGRIIMANTIAKDRLKQAATLKHKAKLQQENQKLRDALQGIHSMANEGLRTDDGGKSYWQIEADAAAALNLSDKERGIEPKETHHLYVTVGTMEAELLNLLLGDDASYLMLAQGGYLTSIHRLTACEFVDTYDKSGKTWVAITAKGREYVQKAE